jgi:anti-sigma factor RsiW
MHAVVMDSLEEYLSGTLEPADRRLIDSHLSACRMCREEVHGMQEVGQLFGTLKSDEAVEPPLGFYARVARLVQEQESTLAPSGWLAANLAFGRRLVFACLVTLAVLGSYLISHESASRAPGPSPEAILAQEDSPGFTSTPARDNMLITLTAYERH